MGHAPFVKARSGAGLEARARGLYESEMSEIRQRCNVSACFLSAVLSLMRLRSQDAMRLRSQALVSRHQPLSECAQHPAQAQHIFRAAFESDDPSKVPIVWVRCETLEARISKLRGP